MKKYCLMLAILLKVVVFSQQIQAIESKDFVGLSASQLDAFTSTQLAGLSSTPMISASLRPALARRRAAARPSPDRSWPGGDVIARRSGSSVPRPRSSTASSATSIGKASGGRLLCASAGLACGKLAARSSGA